MDFINNSLAAQLLAEAINMRASDIHIEPNEKDAQIRLRIDGVLHILKSISLNTYNILVTQLKVASGMDIAEKRVPQDGSCEFICQEKHIDLRSAVLPIIYGEKVTIRILDRKQVLLPLTNLAFSNKNFSLFQKLYSSPYGLVLVTGPTGSGKTTTLYATLQSLDSVKKNIITIEDPVEYRLQGINQVIVNRKAGLDFASGMRAIVRQDPDIIMIGEIRDRETAEMAIHAALTGHLVFSTLHTNDAVSAVERLIDIGIEPYLLAASLKGVLAQRLVRKLCPYCKKKYFATQEEKEFLKQNSDQEIILFKAIGCEYCQGFGYYDRLALQEVLLINDFRNRLILSNNYHNKILEDLIKNNWETMYHDGVSKVLAGLTTVDELKNAGINKGGTYNA